MLETDPCPKCGSKEFYYRDGNEQHYKGRTCRQCGLFAWISKPVEIAYKRPANHTGLVKKYSKGYCEICLIPQDIIPRWESLEAQHIIEYQANPNSERENIIIVCTRCHMLIHWLRTYAGSHILGIKYENSKSQDTGKPKSTETVDTMEDGGAPW